MHFAPVGRDGGDDEEAPTRRWKSHGDEPDSEPEPLAWLAERDSRSGFALNSDDGTARRCAPASPAAPPMGRGASAHAEGILPSSPQALEIPPGATSGSEGGGWKFVVKHTFFQVDMSDDDWPVRRVRSAPASFEPEEEPIPLPAVPASGASRGATGLVEEPCAEPGGEIAADGYAGGPMLTPRQAEQLAAAPMELLQDPAACGEVLQHHGHWMLDLSAEIGDLLGSLESDMENLAIQTLMKGPYDRGHRGPGRCSVNGSLSESQRLAPDAAGPWMDMLRRLAASERLREALRSHPATASLEFWFGGGDSAWPGATDEVDACVEHQDGYANEREWFALSVLVHDVAAHEAPLLVRDGGGQLRAALGRAGAVVMRDVQQWHRGSAHLGDRRPRHMPCFVFYRRRPDLVARWGASDMAADVRAAFADEHAAGLSRPGLVG